MTGAKSQQYRDEVGELIANYVVGVSDKLSERAERAAKAALNDRKFNLAASSVRRGRAPGGGVEEVRDCA